MGVQADGALRGPGAGKETQHAQRLSATLRTKRILAELAEKAHDYEIKAKKLKGEGINTALGVTFEYPQKAPLRSLKIKNAVFTDLFYDQTNIIYVHVNGDSSSLMLNKKTPTHTLIF